MTPWQKALMEMRYRIGYGFHNTITVNSGQVTGTLTNFPVLVYGTFSQLKGVGSGGLVQNASGYDIIFSSTTAANGSGKIPFEVLSYNSATGAFAAYVLFSSIATGSVIYMLYGNSGVTTDQSNTAGVWVNNYLGVYHFATKLGITANSVIGNVNLTNNTAAGLTQGSPGTLGIGGFQCFFSSATTPQQFATTATAANFAVASMTLECWENVASLTGGNSKWFMGAFALNTNHTGGYVRNFGAAMDSVAQDAGTGVYVLRSTSNILTTNTWTYVAGTNTGVPATSIGYFNGAAYAGANVTGGNVSGIGGGGNVLVWIGNLYGAIPADNFPLGGFISEARYSGVVRTPAWLQASYNNQLAPNTFSTVT